MRTSGVLVFSMLLGFYTSPLGAAPQFNRGGDGVCVYENINFQGWEKCYEPGTEVSNLGDRGDSISSIRIYGRARVMVFQDSNFRGEALEFSSNVRDLGQIGGRGPGRWNDAIHSLFVTSGNGGRGNISRGGGRQQERGVCVYVDKNYRGQSQCWERGEQVRDLGGWSDLISSIRVFGDSQVMLYRDIGFRGEYLTVDQDVPDLDQFRGRGFSTWNDQISSIRIEDDRGRPRFGR